MATFKVKLGSNDGNILFRQARGQSETEVADRLRAEGYYVFSISRNFDFGSFLSFGGGIPIKRFLVFNKEFRGLVRAGLPIVEGFDILLKRMKPDRLENLLRQVRERLTKGESLSDAFRVFGDSIPRYYPALLHAGEQSGGLEEVLTRFIEQEDRIRKTRKKFRQTMTYPVILLLAAAVSLAVILTKAMPEFTALYRSSDSELPLMTTVVIGLSEWLTEYYLILLAVIVGAAVGLRFFLATDRGALLWERFLRRIPLLGPVWVLQNQNIFSRTMRLLLGGGIPVPQALAIIAGAVPSRVFGQELQRAHADLLEGASLQEALDRHVRLSEMAAEMIRIGEATGSLGEMLDSVADQGEEQAEDYLELISGMVAPIMLLIVGLVISFLVVAMYLPMFGSYENLGR